MHTLMRCLRLWLMATLMLGASAAWASHIRSYDIQWSVPDPAKPLEVKFVLTVIARADFGSYTDTFAESFNIQIAKLNGAVSTPITTRAVSAPQLGKGVDAGSANPNYRVFRAEFIQVFSAQGTYTATYASSARSSDLANGNKDTDYQVSATVVLDGQRSGPLMAVPPTINLTLGQVNTVSYPMLDTDGDPTSCRFATTTESKLPQPIPYVMVGSVQRYATLSSANGMCTLTFDLTGVSTRQLQVLPLVLESTHNGAISRAGVERLLVLTDKVVPVCTGGGQIALQPLQQFTSPFTVTAGSVVSFKTLGASDGTFTPTPNTAATYNSPISGQFSWTPTAADSGKNLLIQAVFSDTNKLEAYCNYVVNVDASNPSLGVSPPGNVLVGSAPLIQGTSSNTSGGVTVKLTDSAGTVHTLPATLSATGWQVSGPSNLPLGAVSVSVTLDGFAVLPATTSFNVIAPTLSMSPIANVLVGSAPQLQGTVGNISSGNVDLVLTDSTGGARALSASVGAGGAWQVAGPTNLAGGTVSVTATLHGFATTVVAPVTGSFQVLVPVLSWNPVEPLPHGVAPSLSGTVTHLQTGMLDIRITDSAGTRTQQVPVASGAWQFMGPNDLAPGPVTVTATLQGMPGVAPATLNLTVNPVLPVPADAGWALAALGALLAAVGLRRRPMA